MVEDIRLFDGRRTLPRFLTEDEVAALLRAPPGRDGMVVRCLYYLGLTNSELQLLSRDQIDLSEKKVRVSGRDVPIPEGFLPELTAWIEGKTLIFPGRGAEGTLSDRHIRRIVKGMAEEAGVQNPQEIHPHSLRHAYASHLHASGVPLQAIQELLGLARLETAKIYTGGQVQAREWVEKTFHPKSES